MALFLSSGLALLWAEVPKFQSVSGPFPSTRVGSLAWADFDNDDDLDLFITGQSIGTASSTVTSLFRNEEGRFVDTGIILPPYHSSSADWGDFDNDGVLDLVLTGLGTSGTRIFRGLGGTNLALFSTLPGVFDGRAAWGDYNQDGFVDLAITGGPGNDSGFSTRLFLNQRGANFIEAAILSRELYYGTVDWADYDQDGDLDLFLSGEANSLALGAYLYTNDGNALTKGSKLITASGVAGEWFDADNDGWPDLLITAHSTTGSHVLRNDRTGGFVETSPLAVLGKTAVGDVNNDGFSDVLILGYRYSERIGTFVPDVTSLFQNNGTNGWAERTNLFVNLSGGSGAFGDFDNDGRLDLVIQGQRGSQSISYLTKLYRNVVEKTNRPPTAPSVLTSSPDGNRTRLSWSPATDAEQDGGLTYNVRIGTQAGAGDIVHPMSDAGGYRRVVKRGNAESRTNFFIRNLQPGRTYFWSVQAVDNAFAGSAFAPESSFYLNYAPAISTVTNLAILEDDLTEFEVTIADLDSAPNQLRLTADSADQRLLPQSGIQVLREGDIWRVHLRPARDQIGATTLLLRGTDETGHSRTASVAVQVYPVNDRPVALSQAVESLEDSAWTIFLSGFDADGDLLRFIIRRPPLHGSLDGEGPFVTYRPESNYFGIDRFTFAVNDSLTNSPSATVEITILPVVDVPNLTVKTLLRADGQFELRFHGEPRMMYRIESSTNLLDWWEESIGQSPTGDIWINDRVDRPHRFFRLLPVP